MPDSFNEPIRFFIDTEFTDLHFVEKKLISVGAVADFFTNPEHTASTTIMFYKELTDTYKISDCSIFVKQSVLPLLSRKEKHQSDYFNLILDLCKFIEDMPRDVVLVSDAPSWDFSFFTNMLEDSSIRPLNLIALAFFSGAGEIPPEIIAMTEHNAFNDAWINMKWAEQNLKATGNDGIKVIRSFITQKPY